MSIEQAVIEINETDSIEQRLWAIERIVKALKEDIHCTLPNKSSFNGSSDFDGEFPDFDMDEINLSTA